MKPFSVRAAFPLCLLALASCDSGELPTPESPPEEAPLPVPGDEETVADVVPSPSVSPSPSASPPLVIDSTTIALTEAYQDELRAQLTYEVAAAEFKKYRLFSQIADAKQKHLLALAQLFEENGLPVPSPSWTIETVPRSDSARAACEAAEQAESATGTLYTRLLSNQLPEDIVQIFKSYRSAALKHYLPMFKRCRR